MMITTHPTTESFTASEPSTPSNRKLIIYREIIENFPDQYGWMVCPSAATDDELIDYLNDGLEEVLGCVELVCTFSPDSLSELVHLATMTQADWDAKQAAAEKQSDDYNARRRAANDTAETGATEAEDDMAWAQ